MKHEDIERLAYHYIVEKGGRSANPRVQQILVRILGDLFKAIDDLNISDDEVWSALDFLVEAGKQEEILLIASGLGIERFMDIRLEEIEALYGIGGGTPRTIEGPLYVKGAPVCESFARLDDGSEEDEADILFMQGTVCDVNGDILPNAYVEVWHANSKGEYSHFDKRQSAFNLRRTIISDENGKYQFRTIMPAGYGVSPEGMTQKLLDQLGRHGQRPPHIHFFVHTLNYRTLTTQINIDEHKYTHDDYAFADRYALVPKLQYITDPKLIEEKQLDKPYYSIDFEFRLHPNVSGAPPAEVERSRVKG